MISRRLTRSPQPTLKTSPPTDAARAASRLASTTLSMYVKSRDWAPSPWTSRGWPRRPQRMNRGITARSEEHTSELQSHSDLVCRLLLEKKKSRKCAGGFEVVYQLREIARP